MSEIADQCLQFHGGWGYIEEFHIARAWRDQRLFRIGGGTTETMRYYVAKLMGLVAARGPPLAFGECCRTEAGWSVPAHGTGFPMDRLTLPPHRHGIAPIDGRAAPGTGSARRAVRSRTGSPPIDASAPGRESSDEPARTGREVTRSPVPSTGFSVDARALRGREVADPRRAASSAVASKAKRHSRRGTRRGTRDGASRRDVLESRRLAERLRVDDDGVLDVRERAAAAARGSRSGR